MGGILDVLPKPVIKGLVGTVNSVGPLRRLVSKKTINNYAYATPCRPRAISMAADYTCWPGLTDRRYSGRHLGAVAGDSAPAHPDLEQVVALFERKSFRRATDTSLLFPYFAQWFTDSFLRTKWEEGPDRRFRENESNHEIDLCQIYGMSEVQATMLREGRGGRLRTQVINGEEWPAPLFEQSDGRWEMAERYRSGLYTEQNFRRVFDKWPDEDRSSAFAVGLEHGNSTIGNVVMNTLFLREHNRCAALLARVHPDWDDERLFQTARNIVIVELLNIVVSDYIVHIAPIDVRLEAVPGMAEKERWYRNNWMAVEFALLYRWHDLVPDEFTVAGKTYPAQQMLRSNRMVTAAGLDQVLLDASRQYAGRMGLGNTARFLLDREGPNVKRLSLEMGRACQLPSMNAYRKHYGLEPYKSFKALTQDDALAARLGELYGHIDRLEWFVGLFAEHHSDAELMGQLMTTMVANDAFTQALTNPLLSEAVFREETFGGKEGFAVARDTRTLAEVIARNTGIGDPKRVGFTVRAN